jgi:hypothetical protein
VRIAARWYKWFSSTFQFKDEGACENSKHAEVGASTILDVLDAGNGTHINYHTYGYDTYSPGSDGYTSGPAAGFANNVLYSAAKGKWWRYEMVVTGRASSSFRMRLYGRNITDDSAEVTLIDTDEGADHPGQTPPALISRMVSNNHRFGTCNGNFGLSHFLLASWSTDAGQRIGAASEIEGGEGGDVTAPVLSSPNAGTPTGGGTTDAAVTTDEDNGTLYWAVVPNAGSATDAQIKAGAGGDIVAAGNQAVSATGAQTVASITGLAPGTLYQIKFLHADAAANDSNQASVNLTTVGCASTATCLPIRISADDDFFAMAANSTP